MPAAPIDTIFSALGDPTRRAIVERLASGEATVLELAAPFAISLPSISRHLKVLEDAGLISRSRDAQRRPCCLRPEALEQVTAWTEHTRRAWEERLDRLDEYLRDAQARPGAGTPPTTKTTSKKPKTKETDHGRRKKR